MSWHDSRASMFVSVAKAVTCGTGDGMGDEKTTLIEAWFADHDDDGEFSNHPQTPFLVHGPTIEPGRISSQRNRRPSR